MLLQSLWACVEPETEQSANLLHLPGEFSLFTLVFLLLIVFLLQDTSSVIPFMFLWFSVSEPSSKHILPSSPKTKQTSNPSRISPSASQTSSEAHSHLIQTKASDTLLKPSPQREDITKHQTSPQHLSGRKVAVDISKRKRSPKQQKLDDSSPKSNNIPEVSFDAILELFKPMPPCISPLQDLVRVLPFLCFCSIIIIIC